MYPKTSLSILAIMNHKPENISPPHERRSEWLSAIMSSFNSTMIWRAARDRQRIIRMQLRELDIETTKLTRAATTDDFWTFPRIATWLRQYAALHEFVITQYQHLMTTLTRTKRGWSARSRRFRESTVKKAVVLHAYTTILTDVYIDIFVFRDLQHDPWLKWWRRSSSTEPHFFFEPLRTRHIRHVERRWSADDIGHQDARTLRNRWELERTLARVAMYLERRVLEDMLNVKTVYNSGDLFREYWMWVVWTNEERKAWVEMLGLEYKYSREMWAMKVGELQKPEWQPINGVVLSWEEDVELQSWFH